MTEPLRDVEAELLAGRDAFDVSYYRRFGRFPDESQLGPEAVTRIDTANRSSARRSHIQALIEHGATAGERAAARAALGRLEATHRETDQMHRGGNWIDE